MNIAILAPSPYHFVMGGAENFWAALQRYINECTPHACELVKIPTREGNLAELIAAYRQHAQADLRGYDRIVSSKYPSWMSLHPNHALYMLHTLRGLYDTYHFAREPLEPEWTDELAWARQEIALLEHTRPNDNGSVIRLLDMIEAALDSGRIAAHVARFPGPFARHLVHALDRFGTQPARIKAYGTMSHTVARRANYFPPGVECQVVFPPPRLEGFHCGADDHLFTISRLDQPKRIGLLIEAMKHVRSDIPLLIGGTGPDEARLKAMAAGDPRIRFLGPLSDEQLLDAYANALAVPFVPYDEDYGLVTIEAMRSGKPVLTVHDAGGVTEFVRHGHTGLVVAPDPMALAGAIEELCADRNRTRQMGRDARRSVAGIGWKPVAEMVLGVPLPEPAVRGSAGKARRRRKALVAVTFGVTPPRGGGQSRVFNLYRELAREMDVTLLCLCGADEAPSRREIAPGLWELRVPKSAEHLHHENEASREVDWVPLTDIVAAREIHRTPEFETLLDEEGRDADLLIACHPYFASVLRRKFPHLPLWLEAQDVELTLKRSILPDTDAAAALLRLVEAEERLAWQQSEVVFACAQSDLDELSSLYGPTAADTLVVPNGFAEDEVKYTPAAGRARLKALLGAGERPLVLLLASWHGPNLQAVERVLGYAAAVPQALFAVVGSAGLYLRGRELPPNVRLAGVVDAAEKQVFLAAADLAINPMSSGTGSNLKMLDYFAAGVPVLSTGFGARGIDAEAGVHYLGCEIEAFLPSLVQALIDPDRGLALCEAANALAREHYSWRAIGSQALRRLSRHLG